MWGPGGRLREGMDIRVYIADSHCGTQELIQRCKATIFQSEKRQLLSVGFG